MNKQIAALALVAIMYVGRKPIAYDNVAGSGKTWNGHGDVQEVTAHQASVLCKYADQWALADSMTKEDLPPPPPPPPPPGSDADPGGEKQPDPDGTNTGEQNGEGDGAGGQGTPAEGDSSLNAGEVAALPKKALERMTKPELVTYAKVKLGKDMDPNYGKTAMLDQIEEWLTEAE